jgi:hypothetical protein
MVCYTTVGTIVEQSRIELRYDWRSVSQYVLVLSQLWACDQTLFPVWRFLSESYFLVSAGRPLWREVGSAICVSVSSNLSVWTLSVYISCVYSQAMYRQDIQGFFLPQLSTADYALVTSSLLYHDTLVTWIVVHMTAAKFKPLIFSVSDFALSYAANICIFMILDGFCILPA